MGDIEFKEQNEEEGFAIISYKNTNYIITVEQTETSIKYSIDYYKEIIDQTPGELEGEGTEELPYLIQSIEDLVAFSEISADYDFYTNKIYVSLDTDLDFNLNESYVNPSTQEFGDINGNNIIEPLKIELTTGKGFKAIGRFGFKGEFNGNNHSISNLYINDIEYKKHVQPHRWIVRDYFLHWMKVK